MNSKTKSAFSLIEVILSIMLISIITIYSMLFYKDIFDMNRTLFNEEKAKLELFNTKLFLEKNKNLEKLKFEDNSLFYDESLLLKNISTYTFNQNQKYYEIKICIKKIVCQEMVVIK